MTAFATTPVLHMTDLLLIGSNLLIVLATIALSYYTAKVAQETAQEAKREDSRLMRMLVRKNRAARHAKRQRKLEENKVRKIS